MMPIGKDRIFMIFIALLLMVDIGIRYEDSSVPNIISSSRGTLSRVELERELELEEGLGDIDSNETQTEKKEQENTTSTTTSSSSTTKTNKPNPTTTTTEKAPKLEFTDATTNQIPYEENPIRAELAARTCQTDENIFFLKTSKTGSQTLMAIMQRFGIRHNSTFFIGETMNGAMSQVHTPISERDCWIGKNLGLKYNISTQHLKYNKTLIDSVMQPGYKRISIIREPTSNFISSYRYYQYLMQPIWMPMGYRTEKKNPPQALLYKEMETLLQSYENAQKVMNQINPAAFARLGTYRSELLYFGYYTDENGHVWHSYDEDLSDGTVLKWMEQLENEFDLILIMEHYDVSLAVLVLKFCWKIEDVIYMKVNEQTKTGTTLSDNAVKVLEELNRPDYIFYRHFNETLWNTVFQLGFDRVQAVAAEIDARSKTVMNECIEPVRKENHGHLKPVLLESKKLDPDCRAFLAHGPAMTKILQRRMIDTIGPDRYQNCKKARGSTWAENMEARKKTLRDEFKILASSTSYKNQT